MPIYEYKCASCGRRVSVFFRTFREAAEGEARCPHCGSGELSRLVSRVAVLRSEERRLEEMADPSFMAGLENEEPRALAGLMRQMAEESDGGANPELDEVIGRLEAGESPDAIEETFAGPSDEVDGPA